MRLTTGGKNGFGSVGKTDAEIEEMAGRVQLSPADKLYTHIRNGFYRGGVPRRSQTGQVAAGS